MVVSGIYKITSPAGKIYIGKSNDINRRWAHYRAGTVEGQPLLHKSFLEYGHEKHQFEIIHECPESELNEMEGYYHKLINTVNSDHGLNCNYGCNSPKTKLSDDYFKDIESLKKRAVDQDKKLNTQASQLSVINKGWVRNFYFVSSKTEFGNYQSALKWLKDNDYSAPETHYDDVIVPLRKGKYDASEIPKFENLDDQDLIQINGVMICKEWKYGDVEIITFTDKRIINIKMNQ